MIVLLLALPTLIGAIASWLWLGHCDRVEYRLLRILDLWNDSLHPR